MAASQLIHNFQVLVEDLINRYGAEEIAHVANVSIHDLERWRSGGNHYTREIEGRLWSFCFNRQSFDILERSGSVIPAFDLTRKNNSDEFDFHSPPLGEDIRPPITQLAVRPTDIAGLRVNFPLGVSASVLTRNHSTIAFYATRGFDILTYKTVRSKSWPARQKPNWVFIKPNSVTEGFFDAPVIGDLNYLPDDPREASMANSFGVPSEDPRFWKPDIEKAKKSLSSGQILVVSIMATPDLEDMTEKSLINDFVLVAQYAKEAGADIIEANYSCPNTAHEKAAELYKYPKLAGKVSSAIKKAIGDTPFFVKIGYLSKPKLGEFVQHNRAYIQGVVAINTISVPVKSVSNSDFFPGRDRAGISGPIIRPWAQEVVRNLVEIKNSDKLDFSILAVGGVSTPNDVFDYLNLGADAVESCTAALIYPDFAIETRSQFLESGKEVIHMKEKETKMTELEIIEEDNDYSKEQQEENTTQIYEIAVAVSRIEASIPPEEEIGEISLLPIAFDVQNEGLGEAALYFIGDFYQASKDREVRFIRPRTQKILDHLGIPYHSVPPKL